MVDRFYLYWGNANGANGPDGLAVDGAHIYWANPGINTIGRANIDGTGVNQSFITGATTPEGVAVDGFPYLLGQPQCQHDRSRELRRHRGRSQLHHRRQA